MQSNNRERAVSFLFNVANKVAFLACYFTQNFLFVGDLGRCVEDLKIGIGLVLLTYVIVSFSCFNFLVRATTDYGIGKVSNHVSKTKKSKKILLKITRHFAKELSN